MAGENLTTIFNALPQYYEKDLHRQWNRTTVYLDKVRASGGVSDGSGRNVAFVVEFSGATAATVAEGADIPATEYAQDINLPTFAPWATYRSSFQVTEVELDAAASSGNGTPTALLDIFATRILSAGAIIASQIENDSLIGTGVDANGNPNIVGIYGGAVASSGIYLGVNPATYSEWAASQLTNGGTLRQFTPDLIETLDQQIFTAASVNWNLAMTSAGVARKYSQFFTQGSPGNNNIPLVRYMGEGPNQQYALGVPNDERMQYDTMWLKGRQLLRNRLNPAGKLALLNTDKIMFKYLPHTASMQRDLTAFFQLIGIEGRTGSETNTYATGIPMRVARIAKTGDSVKVSMKTVVQQVITRRNAHGILQDISEV